MRYAILGPARAEDDQGTPMPLGGPRLRALLTALALRHRKAPPTLSVEHQDPDCNLDVVPNAARDLPNLSFALSNSFAFGGHNVCLALRKSCDS